MLATVNSSLIPRKQPLSNSSLPQGTSAYNPTSITSKMSDLLKVNMQTIKDYKTVMGELGEPLETEYEGVMKYINVSRSAG